MRAPQRGSRRRSLRTRLDSPIRPSSDSCFRRAKQSSRRPRPTRLVVVPSGRPRGAPTSARSWLESSRVAPTVAQGATRARVEPAPSHAEVGDETAANAPWASRDGRRSPRPRCTAAATPLATRPRGPRRQGAVGLSGHFGRRSSSAVAVSPLPPRMEEKSPSAVFSEPPLIEDNPPLARPNAPPLIEDSSPSASLCSPPLTDAHWPLAVLLKPPLTEE
jgi:hypothetical protein